MAPRGRAFLAPLGVLVVVFTGGCFPPVYYIHPTGPTEVVTYTVATAPVVTEVVTPREVMPGQAVAPQSPTLGPGVAQGPGPNQPPPAEPIPSAEPTSAPAPLDVTARPTAPVISDDSPLDGLRQIAAGQHQLAAEVFQRAAEGSSEPLVLFNSAVCLDRLGEREAAMRVYRLLERDETFGVYARARLALLSSDGIDPPTDEDSERARAEFLRGMELFQGEDIQAAIGAFQRAYELVHHPRILFNLGVCYQRLGDRQTAATFYHLVLFDSQAEEETRELTRRRLEEVLGDVDSETVVQEVVQGGSS